MQKNIMIAVLIVVAIFSVAFGYNQKQEADMQRALAERYAALARRNELQAKEMQELANQERMRANYESVRVMETLRECETSKKKSK